MEDIVFLTCMSIWSSSPSIASKYSPPVLPASLRHIFTKVCDDFEASLIEMDGEDNHVHLLVQYPPKISVSVLVNSLKGVSSRLLRTQHPEFQNLYWNEVLWSPSYFAVSCGGAPISIIRQYIENQQSPL